MRNTYDSPKWSRLAKSRQAKSRQRLGAADADHMDFFNKAASAAAAAKDEASKLSAKAAQHIQNQTGTDKVGTGTPTGLIRSIAAIASPSDSADDASASGAEKASPDNSEADMLHMWKVRCRLLPWLFRRVKDRW